MFPLNTNGNSQIGNLIAPLDLTLNDLVGLISRSLILSNLYFTGVELWNSYVLLMTTSRKLIMGAPQSHHI